MIYHKNDIIKYRVEKAYRTLEEADSLIESGFWSGAVNRLYYCSFHLVSALLLKAGINANTHRGVRTQFFKNFIKTELLDRKYSTLYSDLMNKRQEGDYDDFIDYDESVVVPLASEVREFMDSVLFLINEES